MNVPNNVFENIFSRYGYSGVEFRKRLIKASETYSIIHEQRKHIDTVIKESEHKKGLLLSIITACQKDCEHIWERHRSGVDSADDYEECMICGKQQ